MSKLNRARIGDICIIEKGTTGLAKAVPGKYPLVATGAERKSSCDFQFDAKAVCIPLVSSTGHGKKTLNYVHYQEGKFALGSILAALIPKDEKVLDARYLHAYLQKNKDRVLVPLMKGAANVSLSVKAISDIAIPLPSLQKQAELLVKIDSISSEHTELLNELVVQEKLFGKLSQAILQEAIEGKITSNWRKQNSHLISGEHHASKLLERIRAEKGRLFNEGKIRRYKPLPLITDAEKPFALPVGWAWCRLGELVEASSTGPFGSMLHKSDYVMNGIPIVNPMNMVNRRIIPDKRMLISEKTRERLKHYELHQGDVVIARRGNLAKCAVVNSGQAGFLCGTGSFFLRLLCVNLDFFVLAYCSKKSQAYLLQDSIGQTMDNLNQTLLAKLPICLPPLAEQGIIVQYINKFTTMIDDLEKQVADRKQQSDRLMQSVLREAFEHSHA